MVKAYFFAFVALVGGIACAAAAFVLASHFTGSLAALSVSALLTAFLTATLLTLLILSGLRNPVPRLRISLLTGFLAVPLCFLIARPVLFRPLARPVPPSNFSPSSWTLSTGSRIAWRKFPSALPVAGATPIVFIHGGPGFGSIECLPGTNRLARSGHDVYYYDQLGAGLSGRLDNPAGYTIERHVADLEAIRATIGAEKLILIGASWGGTLLAQYMAAHPTRVEKAVFVSPGAIEPAEWVGKDNGNLLQRLPKDRQARLRSQASQPRMQTAIRMARINPRAAHNFLGDAEFDAFVNIWMADAVNGATCGSNASPSNPHPCLSGGYWSNIMTVMNSEAHSENAIARLRTNKTPALILSGECNYVSQAITNQYIQVLQNGKLTLVKGAGHIIVADKPDEYYALIEDFLENQSPKPPGVSY